MKKTKLLVPFSQKTLDRMTAKFLSRSSAFKPQKVSPAFAPLPKGPRYPAHVHGTRQSPCLPFESGPNTLPGMEKFKE